MPEQDNAGALRDLELEIAKRIDPDFSKHIELLTPLADSQVFSWVLRLLKIDPEALRSPLHQAKKLLTELARSVATFTAIGWAPSASVPAEDYAEALARLDDTGSLEAAEEVLVRGWNDGDGLRWRLKRVLTLGVGEPDLEQVAHARARLIEKALEHHRQEAFEASVPIALAQADGIVHDFGGVSLFSNRHPSSPLQDGSTIAGMAQGLAAIRQVLGANAPTTGSTGNLLRHGVMHGRELGYDTLLNSTKSLVLLVAVIEWAQPLAQAVARERRDAHETKYAGSAEVDEFGRRLDDRGFSDARASLRWLSVCQMGQWRNHERYASDLEAMLSGPLGDKALKGRDAITMITSPDGSSFHAWRATPSGWVLGIAGQDGPSNEFYFAGPSPPSGPPGVDAAWCSITDDYPPDWEPR